MDGQVKEEEEEKGMRRGQVRKQRREDKTERGRRGQGRGGKKEE